MTAKETIIIRRLLRELEAVDQVILGPGIPSHLKAYLAPEIEVFENGQDGLPRRVDAVVVEAAEVSVTGDLVLPPGELLPLVESTRWIVATRHTTPEGTPKIVGACRLPVVRPRVVTTIITELGVMRVSPTALVLEEIAPGVSSDDVKKATAASLHVADSIHLMEL